MVIAFKNLSIQLFKKMKIKLATKSKPEWMWWKFFQLKKNDEFSPNKQGIIMRK
jgi:hypothetical protein